MLNGSDVDLQIFAPTLQTPITQSVSSTVSSSAVEFNDVSFYDLNGDPYHVVAGQFDVVGSRVNYKIIQQKSGTFVNVNDSTGFNGYALSFNALGPQTNASIYSAEIIASQTSLKITKSDVFFDNDTLFVNVDGLRFIRGDTISIELGFLVKGTSGGEQLTGGNGRDKIRSGSGGDTLNGLGGNDQLHGEANNDTLAGGRGADDLYGGAGKDCFFFSSIRDSTVTSSGRDTIFDFSKAAGDRISVQAIDANSRVKGNQAFSFIGSQEFHHKAGELRYERKASDTFVYGDVNGDGKADFAIHLDDAVTLTRAYFVL